MNFTLIFLMTLFMSSTLYGQGKKVKERITLDISLKESVAVGDTIHVHINSDLPIYEINKRLVSPTLINTGMTHTTTTFSANLYSSKTTVHYLLIYQAVQPGSVAFEELKFKFEGKVVEVPLVETNVYIKDPRSN